MHPKATRFGRYCIRRIPGGYEVLPLEDGKPPVHWCSTREAAIAKCWELTRRDAKSDGTYGRF